VQGQLVLGVRGLATATFGQPAGQVVAAPLAGLGQITPAACGAFARLAEEVRLELDGGKAAGALRERGDAAVAAARIGERDHRGGVQKAIRRHHFSADHQAAFHGFARNRDDFHTEVAGQVALAETVEVLAR